jgi:hypothetical protein
VAKLAKPAEPCCRLYALQARDGRSAVVFRRGPSKQVCLVRWNLATDALEVGQWFKGRVYERRSDLSPDGALLVYFAARYRGTPSTWTAVSRPPYFTALALWGGLGTWGGGGLFVHGRRLGLNHVEACRTLFQGFALPKGFEVEPVADWAGHGEDDPIEHVRMERDGWRMVSAGQRSDYRREAPARWIFTEPQVYERRQPGAGASRAAVVTLRRELRAIGVTEGPWLQHDFAVHGPTGELRRFPGCDWADWHLGGDLLIAISGALFRLPAAAAQSAAQDPLADARLIADLAELRFVATAAPASARKWP